MFFRRRSSRANSYVDDAASRSQSIDEKRPDSSRTQPTQQQQQLPQHLQQHQQQQQQQQPLPPVALALDDGDMYPRPQQPQETALPQRHAHSQSNGHAHGGMALPMGAPAPPNGGPAPMPDLLTQAFNQAIRPYMEKIDQLESQLAEQQAWIAQLESQRTEMFHWIDKRGLRPDVPDTLAKIMDTTTPDAALTLNAQLDRKITIVNFDLHRLQDDLNDSISSSHFASAMLKFLPDVQRLAQLPTGPRYAFDLLLKLGGNLNSHGGLDGGEPGDIDARRDFYTRLDAGMVDVVSRRFGDGEDWNVQREIKRIEKTAHYLKGFGVEPYFPQTLDLMKRELEFQIPNGGQPNGQGTPPRYH